MSFNTTPNEELSIKSYVIKCHLRSIYMLMSLNTTVKNYILNAINKISN